VNKVADRGFAKSAESAKFNISVCQSDAFSEATFYEFLIERKGRFLFHQPNIEFYTNERPYKLALERHLRKIFIS